MLLFLHSHDRHLSECEQFDGVVDRLLYCSSRLCTNFLINAFLQCNSTDVAPRGLSSLIWNIFQIKWMLIWKSDNMNERMHKMPAIWRLPAMLDACVAFNASACACCVCICGQMWRTWKFLIWQRPWIKWDVIKMFCFRRAICCLRNAKLPPFARCCTSTCIIDGVSKRMAVAQMSPIEMKFVGWLISQSPFRCYLLRSIFTRHFKIDTLYV